MAVDWKVAGSLLQLRDQLNRLAPLRSTKSDGFKGNAAHEAKGRASDHNPWWLFDNQHWVTAGDFTHDADNGLDCNRLWSALQVARDRRIKYLIWDEHIVNSRWVVRNGINYAPWTVLPYLGPNPHNKHLHVSVLPNMISLETWPWLLPGMVEDELPSVEDIFNFPIRDEYTKEPGDVMPASAAIAWGTSHAAHAADRAAAAEAGVLRVEKKLDDLIAAVREGRVA